MGNNIAGITFNNGQIIILDENGIARDITLADYLQEIIDTANLAPDAVTGDKIEDDAIDSEHIVANAVDSDEIAPRAVLLKHLDDEIAISLYLALSEQGELKELRANEKYGYANVEER